MPDNLYHVARNWIEFQFQKKQNIWYSINQFVGRWKLAPNVCISFSNFSNYLRMGLYQILEPLNIWTFEQHMMLVGFCWQVCLELLFLHKLKPIQVLKFNFSKDCRMTGKGQAVEYWLNFIKKIHKRDWLLNSL